MIKSRFLQIHTLHSYTAALLNRDDSGLAKRLTFGGVSRIRISSQCLKRHWRKAQEVDENGKIIKDDPHALQNLEGYVNSLRSRELVTEKIIAPLKGRFTAEIVAALEPEFQQLVYGDKADKGEKSRQTLLLGKPELDWLAREAERLASRSDWRRRRKKGYRRLAKRQKLQGHERELRLAPANSPPPCSAAWSRLTPPPISTHRFMSHTPSPFTARRRKAIISPPWMISRREDDDGGADTIQETELTCGLFYGYTVIDLPRADRQLRRRQ